MGAVEFAEKRRRRRKTAVTTELILSGHGVQRCRTPLGKEKPNAEADGYGTYFLGRDSGGTRPFRR
jgi:hypothetical protein